MIACHFACQGVLKISKESFSCRALWNKVLKVTYKDKPLAKKWLWLLSVRDQTANAAAKQR